LLTAIWKDKYKEEELPEELSLLLGELKFKLNLYPLAGEPINDELLLIETDS
jgi:hypothetical protein